MNSNEHAIDYASARGWQVVEVSDAGIQFRKPRGINPIPAAILFVLSMALWLIGAPDWLPILGIGIAILVIILDLLRSKERKVFLPSNAIERNDFTEL